ncbi:MAG: DUF262 domain-containing protein [Bacteroidales bacterium]|nr:DUF262 domain-containing protein [Bacteroidales bacterium]
MEYNSLITGKSYKLTDLFSKDNKIIIPDLQRDYCWGTPNDKDGNNLVAKFFDSLYENKDKELNLGLLYGYEAPLGHIQLCDGQQRITTLFLLLGMLNKNTDDVFRRLLISESEENDDWEPYLQYAIRESSLYFLSDLTRFFFIENKALKVDEIKTLPWYFKDYDLDPSIQSMIVALKTIEQKIVGIDCKSFGLHIAEQLNFLYYNMGNRNKGEETFVVINTTGEPLSSTENLKPLLISKQPIERQKECAQKWEQWEQFFWKNRGKNDTANNGLKEFFRWVMLLQQPSNTDGFKRIQSDGNYKFDINIPFDVIDEYFKIVSEKLFASENAIFPNNRQWLAPDIDGNTQIVWFRLLPVLEYLYRFKDASAREVWRVRMFFRNLSKVPRVESDLYNRDIKRLGKVLPDAIRIAKEMPSKDICSILQLEGVSATLISEEVKKKLDIYSHVPNRNEVEESFWKEEESNIWCGEIMPMISWASEANSFDYNFFESYRAKFNKVFHDDLKYNELDITRRALLTCGLKDYPRIFNGYTNYSFAWEHTDWKALINDNVAKFKSFLDALDIDDIYKAQEEMIAVNPSSKDYDEFVKIPELLEYCEQKNIQWWGDELGWVLINKGNARGPYANLKSYRLHLYFKKKVSNCYVWFYSKESSCAVIEENKEQKGWAIDAWHIGNDRYAINLFRRQNSSLNSFGELPMVFNLLWNGERYEKKDMAKDQAIELVLALIAKLS